jgi:hypothetical protein
MRASFSFRKFRQKTGGLTIVTDNLQFNLTSHHLKDLIFQAFWGKRALENAFRISKTPY